MNTKDTKAFDNHRNCVVGIGEALWDLLPDGKKVGGAPANFAFHVSQLGLPALVVSAVGNDDNGRELLEFFDRKKLQHLTPTVDYPTGTVHVALDKNGIPSYNITENVAWDHIPFSIRLESVAAVTRAVCFGSLAQRDVVSRSTIQGFVAMLPDDGTVLKIFDINLRQNFYTPLTLTQSFKLCNILKINDEELGIVAHLFGYPIGGLQDQCRALMADYDIPTVILTCGAVGSYVFTAAGETSFVETPRVEVADTVGAGDSFTAGFTAALIRGNNIAEAHRLAVSVAAHVCSCAGAMPELPLEIIENYGKTN